MVIMIKRINKYLSVQYLFGNWAKRKKDEEDEGSIFKFQYVI